MPPDPADLVAEALDVLEFVGCQFWACEGPTLELVAMVTCRACEMVAKLRLALGQPAQKELDRV